MELGLLTLQVLKASVTVVCRVSGASPQGTPEVSGSYGHTSGELIFCKMQLRPS